MIRANLLLLFLLTTTLGFPLSGHAAETQVLLIATQTDHPFGSHMYALEARLLQKCLQRQGDCEVRIAQGWPPEETALQADVFVFYSKPAGDLLADSADMFGRELERGAGFVAIHWGTGVGYSQPTAAPAFRRRFQSWLGGWFRRPPCDIRVDRSRLTLVNRTHPIARGFHEETIRDEFYLNPVLSPHAEPLLQVNVENQNHVVGWTFQRKTGRSVGITLGHFHDNFTRTNFRRLLVNSVLWAANREVPQSGADVTLAPQDVALPKQ